MSKEAAEPNLITSTITSPGMSRRQFLGNALGLAGVAVLTAGARRVSAQEDPPLAAVQPPPELEFTSIPDGSGPNETVQRAKRIVILAANGKRDAAFDVEADHKREYVANTVDAMYQANHPEMNRVAEKYVNSLKIQRDQGEEIKFSNHGILHAHLFRYDEWKPSKPNSYANPFFTSIVARDSTPTDVIYSIRSRSYTLQNSDPRSADAVFSLVYSLNLSEQKAIVGDAMINAGSNSESVQKHFADINNGIPVSVEAINRTMRLYEEVKDKFNSSETAIKDSPVYKAFYNDWKKIDVLPDTAEKNAKMSDFILKTFG
jgi:hypothetical protein